MTHCGPFQPCDSVISASLLKISSVVQKKATHSCNRKALHRPQKGSLQIGDLLKEIYKVYYDCNRGSLVRRSQVIPLHSAIAIFQIPIRKNFTQGGMCRFGVVPNKAAIVTLLSSKEKKQNPHRHSTHLHPLKIIQNDIFLKKSVLWELQVQQSHHNFPRKEVGYIHQISKLLQPVIAISKIQRNDILDYTHSSNKLQLRHHVQYKNLWCAGNKNGCSLDTPDKPSTTGLQTSIVYPQIDFTLKKNHSGQNPRVFCKCREKKGRRQKKPKNQTKNAKEHSNKSGK